MRTKKVITMVACAAMVLSFAACGNNSQENMIEEPMIGGNSVQIANPWTECKDITEAVKNAGFSFEVPESIEGYKMAYVQNMGSSLIDVLFEATDSEEIIHIRKGSGSGDISGDYNVYSETAQVTVGNYEVTLKGNDGTVSLATWTSGDYSFALSTPKMTSEAVIAIIGQIK